MCFAWSTWALFLTAKLKYVDGIIKSLLVEQWRQRQQILLPTANGKKKKNEGRDPPRTSGQFNWKRIKVYERVSLCHLSVSVSQNGRAPAPKVPLSGCLCVVIGGITLTFMAATKTYKNPHRNGDTFMVRIRDCQKVFQPEYRESLYRK